MGLCAAFLVIMFAFAVVLPTGSTSLLYIAAASLGFALAPSLTIGIEFACEVGFPVGEAYSNGMIQIVGNIITICFTTFLPNLLEEGNETRSYYLIGIVWGLMFISFIFVIVMKEQLNR